MIFLQISSLQITYGLPDVTIWINILSQSSRLFSDNWLLLSAYREKALGCLRFMIGLGVICFRCVRFVLVSDKGTGLGVLSSASPFVSCLGT